VLNGVCGAGLHTTGQPAAKAGAIFVRGEQQRVVEPRDAHDHADRHPQEEADHAVPGGQPVQGDRLTGHPACLLRRGLQRQQGPLHLDAAVTQRLTRLEDEKLLDVGPTTLRTLAG